VVTVCCIPIFLEPPTIFCTVLWQQSPDVLVMFSNVLRKQPACCHHICLQLRDYESSKCNSYTISRKKIRTILIHCVFKCARNSESSTVMHVLCRVCNTMESVSSSPPASTLQDTARNCKTLQDTAQHCNALQHTAIQPSRAWSPETYMHKHTHMHAHTSEEKNFSESLSPT